MDAGDYRKRKYLSAAEAARFLGVSVKTIHNLVRTGGIGTVASGSGQRRFNLNELKKQPGSRPLPCPRNILPPDSAKILRVNGTTQKIIVKSAARLAEMPGDSIHLMVTSPPYFDAKMYSVEPLAGDLGNVHDIDAWFTEIGEVWQEVFRVLQPGRKAFINIMNLPVRTREGGFRTLNLVGRTIDVCERAGFIFKRDIVWQKTNGVRAHFGTYPYPGGILINNMHEFILEFEKPDRKGFRKYGHLTREQKEESRLDKDFWLSLKNSDVWLMKPQNSGDGRTHVAPFPLELPYRLIKAFSYVGETVLDPFAGSGTTLLAAANLRRNGVGYEINPEIAFAAVQTLAGFAV